jgi:hypothetical protein
MKNLPKIDSYHGFWIGAWASGEGDGAIPGKMVLDSKNPF